MEVDATPFWRLDFNGFHPTSGPFWLTCLTYLLQELLQQTGTIGALCRACLPELHGSGPGDWDPKKVTSQTCQDL